MTVEKDKTIYMFHKLVFHRRDDSFKCFIRETHNYGLWQPVPVRYHVSEERSLSLVNYKEG